MSCTPVRAGAGALVLAALLLTGIVAAGEPRPPGPGDRCPVCGMFVEKYRNWTATVVLEDGSQLFFDGPKDMFKLLLDPARYGRDASSISRAFVTDYYTTRLIDARTATFVVGSDVMGPMGHELVPLQTAEEAETFVKDHGGAKRLAYDDVTADDLPK
jgi:copper chaperone NosL